MESNMCVKNVHEAINHSNKQLLPPLPLPMASIIDKSNNMTILHLNVNKLIAKQLDKQCDVTLIF